MAPQLHLRTRQWFLWVWWRASYLRALQPLQSGFLSIDSASHPTIDFVVAHKSTAVVGHTGSNQHRFHAVTRRENLKALVARGIASPEIASARFLSVSLDLPNSPSHSFIRLGTFPAFSDRLAIPTLGFLRNGCITASKDCLSHCSYQPHYKKAAL